MRKISVLMIALAFTACGDTGLKEVVGLERTPPDEFAVYKRAPLEMPPDYSLRPPRPGAPRPQEEDVVGRARETVLGTSESTAQNTTQGEAVILQRAGASTAAPDIRQTVDQEKDEAAAKDRPVVDRLLDFEEETPGSAPARVVDPKAEAERLKQNKATGKPVTTGQTPVKVQ